MEEDIDVKAIAHHELEGLKSARQTILEEHSASYRWLMASMLAINAGGLLAVSDKEQIEGVLRAAAAACFVLGILASLAIAWLGQMSSRKMLLPLTEMSAFWAVVAASGEFEAEEHNRIVASMQAVVSKTMKARIVGWVSVLAFVSGVVCAGVGLNPFRQTVAPIEGPSADSVEMPADSAALPSRSEQPHSNAQAVEVSD